MRSGGCFGVARLGMFCVLLVVTFGSNFTSAGWFLCGCGFGLTLFGLLGCGFGVWRLRVFVGGLLPTLVRVCVGVFLPGGGVGLLGALFGCLCGLVCCYLFYCVCGMLFSYLVD